MLNAPTAYPFPTGVGLAEPETLGTLPWKLGLEEEQAWDRRSCLQDQKPWGWEETPAQRQGLHLPKGKCSLRETDDQTRLLPGDPLFSGCKVLEHCRAHSGSPT